MADAMTLEEARRAVYRADTDRQLASQQVPGVTAGNLEQAIANFEAAVRADERLLRVAPLTPTPAVTEAWAFLWLAHGQPCQECIDRVSAAYQAMRDA